MGQVRVHEFVSLDGVFEDPSWTAPYGFPDDLSAAVGALTAASTGILLGRRTFELFAPAWSARSDEDDPGATFFNGTPKHVVSSTLDSADAWSGSQVVGPYDVDVLRGLRDEADLYVSGSGTVVRAMLADGLVDELHLFVYPVVLGSGARLLPDGTARLGLRLVSAEALSNGVAHLTYAPAA